MKRYNLKRLTITVMLSALGILIPLIMPKIVIGPASYTLGSHVPIIIAMFLGWDIALMVGLSGGLGFFLALGPIVSARAFSHLLWAIPGAFIIQLFKNSFRKWHFRFIFNIIISFFHALFECIVVLLFYTEKLSDQNFLVTTILLSIGVGGFIHSMVDYEISSFVYGRLKDQIPNLLSRSV